MHSTGGGECNDCSKKELGLQRKLVIGASDDPLEREADRIADQVMAVPAHSRVSGTLLRIQRFSGYAKRQMEAVPASVERALVSTGKSLDTAVRQDMEHRFGHDFSRVQVHTDESAALSARAINARAYTVGSDIAFAAGHYAPHTVEGHRLLAHELTHVVQQSAGGAGTTNVARDEAEADRVAGAATAGAVLPPISASRPGLRKQDAPRVSTEEGDAFRAEMFCDLRTLCQLHFAHPHTVDTARAMRAFRNCAPSRLATATPGLDPCLTVGALTPSTGSLTAGSQPSPAVTPARPGKGSTGGTGIHLPSTKLKFQLGDLKTELDLPSSLTAALPLSDRGAQVVAFKLEAKTSGDFALTITINAVPHVRISLRAGMKVGGTPQGSAGLVIEASDTICHAGDPLTAHDKLDKAGKKLRDAVLAAQQSAQPEKLADVVSAIVGVQSEIDAAKAKCKQVTRARLEFGAHTPLGPFSPHTPPTAGDLGTAPYVGGTLTIPFD
jgi:hypothetical protein